MKAQFSNGANFPPHILTFTGFVILSIGLFCLPIVVCGDIVRENSTTIQTTGHLNENDVAIAQTSTYGAYAPTDGDVITIYSDAVQSTTVGQFTASVGGQEEVYGIPYSVKEFTIRGGEDNGNGYTPKIQKIVSNVSDEGLLYSIAGDNGNTAGNEKPMVNLVFQDLNYVMTSQEGFIPGSGGRFVQYESANSDLNVSLNNVSISGSECIISDFSIQSDEFFAKAPALVTNGRVNISDCNVITKSVANLDFTNNGQLTFERITDFGLNVNKTLNFINNGQVVFVECLSGGVGSNVNITNNGQLIFQNSNYAFYVHNFYRPSPNFTFTGNGAAVFTNNANADLVFAILDEADHVLTFTGSGTYEFDGGINRIDGGVLMTAKITTNIDEGASVTISGRENRCGEYYFGEVNLSNGGRLTVSEDQITELFSETKFKDANSVLTVKNKNGSHSATIKSSTGNGVAGLIKGNGNYWQYNVYEKWLQDKGFDAISGVGKEGLFISSGRIDVKGCFDQSIVLQREASFSPGNSAGTVEIDGDFISLAGATLIFEQEGNVYDQMIANNVTIDPETNIELLFTDFTPGSVYDIIIANDALNVDQSWIDMIQGLLPDDFEALIYNGNTVRLQSVVVPSAVPEPSTWALMFLGVAGLMYWRKRK